MKVKLNKELKVKLLHAIKEGELNFDIFPELKGRNFKDMIEDARTLTKVEARELWGKLEQEC